MYKNPHVHEHFDTNNKFNSPKYSQTRFQKIQKMNMSRQCHQYITTKVSCRNIHKQGSQKYKKGICQDNFINTSQPKFSKHPT